VNFTHYSDQCVQSAADLVNTKGYHSGNEHMGTPEAAREFLLECDFWAVGEVTETDLADLHAVRERLEEVFYTPDERVATAVLNELIDDYEVKPYLTDHDGRWHLHYSPEGTAVGRRVAADVVMGLAALIAEHGFERLGVCAADNCANVFVDTSRNKSRRYCNDVCSSRVNVAAHRARARSQTAS
jgi:predicted RNA-binding Zn ribbon-like protein